MDVTSLNNTVYPFENCQLHNHSPRPPAVLPICDWATNVDFRSQSGENGSPNSASLSPCGKESSLVQTWVGGAQVKSSPDTKPRKAVPFIS